MRASYITERRAFHDGRAQFRPAEQKRYYNALLRRYYRLFIPPNARVLEIGCGVGDLLAAVQPVFGVGVDFSEQAIVIARERHPELHFVVGAAEKSYTEGTEEDDAGSQARAEGSGTLLADSLARPPDFGDPTHEEVRVSGEPLCSGGRAAKFDYIILSDLVNDLADVQAVLEKVREFAHERTRVVLNFFNNLWHPVLSLAERLKLKAPNLQQNWLSSSDMRNLLDLAGWEVVREEKKIICPIGILFVESFLNRISAPFLGHLCLTIFQVGRLRENRSKSSQEESKRTKENELTVSVVIPARNEEGNIEAAVQRLPRMGRSTEIIFVEGHSRDGTWQEINRVAEKYVEHRIKVLKQKSKGKGGAVREAFEVATGDILMILDADLTMSPEELPKFYEAVRSGCAEFVNGVRLVYPMEDEAMRFLNMVANKAFGLSFSWLLGQSVKDTLCGTKVLFRRDYQEIARNRSHFGEFDPFGDFDLLFGAAKLNLKIVDMPIRYAARTYGETNISRWRHGMLLLRMVMFAAKRLKFI
jgi:SAM-dependent methyltransferase